MEKELSGWLCVFALARGHCGHTNVLIHRFINYSGTQPDCATLKLMVQALIWCLGVICQPGCAPGPHPLPFPTPGELLWVGPHD